MSIAAVIPTYNAAAFLEGTLASVFAQTRVPDEVIVVDDASTDDTAAIARRLGATVITLEKNSGGPSKPLNWGIAAATSEWIATLDHDDRWHPEWLARALAACETADVMLAIGRVANPESQQVLDARWDHLWKLATPCGEGVARLDQQLAYNELVPALNYGVTCSNMVFARTLGEGVEFDGSVRLCCDYRFLQDVTLLEPIALANDTSCDWIPAPHSLYQRGSMDALDRDLFYVYRQFETVVLDADMRTLLKKKCRHIANDLAYAARERGEYFRAFVDYCNGLRFGGLNRTALAGIVKLPLAMLRAPLRKASASRLNNE